MKKKILRKIIITIDNFLTGIVLKIKKHHQQVLIALMFPLFIFGTWAADDRTAYGLEQTTEQTTEQMTETCINSTSLNSTFIKGEYPQKIVENSLDPIFQGWLFDYCEYQEISPYLVIAIIETESSCDPNAKSPDGSCVGLMQVSTYWHKAKLEKMGLKDFYNPYQNVMVGIEILQNYLEHNSLEWALTCYNGGADYANSMNGTSEYARTIIERAGELAR